MKRLLLLLVSLALAACVATAFAQTAAPQPADHGPVVPKPVELKGAASEEVCVLKTNLGTMVFRFFDKDAPLTTAQIKKLVRAGFYDGKPFYRVVKGHVIQTGDGDGGDRKVASTVPSEVNSHPHIEGAMGLAHGTDPNSGSTEIYICLAPRPHLDNKFTVFAQLIEGQDVLEKIGNVEVVEHYEGTAAFHKPKEPVVIEKATIETRPVP